MFHSQVKGGAAVLNLPSFFKLQKVREHVTQSSLSSDIPCASGFIKVS